MKKLAIFWHLHKEELPLVLAVLSIVLITTTDWLWTGDAGFNYYVMTWILAAIPTSVFILARFIVDKL